MISVDQLIGCAPFGPRDEALNHDHYLYGWSRESSRKAAGGHRRLARPVQHSGSDAAPGEAVRLTRGDRPSAGGSKDPLRKTHTGCVDTARKKR